MSRSALTRSSKPARREAAVLALVRYGVSALAPLRATCKKADDNLRWRIDATIQEIERNIAKAGGTAVHSGNK